MGFVFQKLKSLYLKKTQGNLMRPTAMITICKYCIKPQQGVDILCPAGSTVKRKVTGLILCNLGRRDP